MTTLQTSLLALVIVLIGVAIGLEAWTLQRLYDQYPCAHGVDARYHYVETPETPTSWYAQVAGTECVASTTTQ